MVLNLGEVVENWAQAARDTTEWFPCPRHSTCRAASSRSTSVGKALAKKVL